MVGRYVCLVMSRGVRIALFAAGIYVLAWAGYVVKSAAGISLLPGHHGGMFPGSGNLIARLHHT